ncbi:MAG: glycogen debranching protein [Chloroflexi bacterium]|nr:glycogen debranching protein [Chloroflexota bacterium]
MNNGLISEGRRRAEQILISNANELGSMGSRNAYQQVWARDSMVAGLGLLLCQDAEAKAIHRRSLATLRAFQSRLGKIPHNVGFSDVYDPALVAMAGRLQAEDQPRAALADTTHAGVVDSNLWYILGQYYDFALGGDLDLLKAAWPSLEKALLWLRYQDSNECGLLEVHEAMDWADLFSNRYNVLFDNVLYYAAWKAMAVMAEAQEVPAETYAATAEDVRRKINTLLWVGPEAPKDWDWVRRERQEWLYPLRLVETELVVRPHYLPYMAFRDYGDRFDTFGNLLAILFGVADRRQADLILNYLHGCGINSPYPVRSVYPPIQRSDRDWRDFFQVRNLNQPNHYHNGGAWPFIGGFYVAALVQAGRLDEAQRQLELLTEMNHAGVSAEWEFNEWFHGTSGRPMGFAEQTWSAAMYVYAVDAVEHGRANVFNSEQGWHWRTT